MKKCILTVVIFLLLMSAFTVGTAHADGRDCHVVQSGDTLWDIGQRYGYGWSYLAKVNKLESPHLIFPGQVICFGEPSAVEFALAQIGEPYVWGGIGGDGYDCSGLVQRAYLAEGIRLPRTASWQYMATLPVYKAERGDLVFFSAVPRGIVAHVGIALDSETMIHASAVKGEVGIDRIENRHYFVSYGRVCR